MASAARKGHPATSYRGKKLAVERVAAYARVSTEMQAEEGLSITAQLNEIREYATARSWTVVSEFVDAGITGQTLDRPGLQNMLTAAEQGAFDVVIVHELSRLSRSSVYDTFSIFDRLGRCKVGFASVKEPEFDLSSPTGRFLLTMIAAINQYYIDILRMHTKKAKRERAREGLYNASVTPYGYAFGDSARVAPVVVPAEAEAVTQTMEHRPEIGLDSYDRFFPSQDTLPKGGLGNLIALPLQKKPRESGNSLFLDDHASPYPDQWAFLSAIRRMTRQEVEAVVAEADAQGEFLGIRMPVTDEDDARPWVLPPSGRHKAPPVSGPLPEQLDLVLGNQIYVPKADLSPSLRNRLIRLAAFQNPEFYQAQAMRLSTFGKPRIISCCEDYPQHLGLPAVASTSCSTCSDRTG